MKKVACLILAGGSAKRLGGEKALAPYLGTTLIESVIARVRPQVDGLALSIRREDEPAFRKQFGNRYPLLFDRLAPEAGPLAGVLAGLAWLDTLGAAEWLATFPCDTPFLPPDLVPQLMTVAGSAPVFACDAVRLHGTCAVWPLACFEVLRAGVESGRLRSLHSAMDALRGKTCRIDAGEHAFFNVNTSADLRRAEDLARMES